MSQVWEFDVTVSTHDALKKGVTAGRLRGSQHSHQRVTISAPDFTTAFLSAYFMISRHGEVTGVYLRI